jgi:hypothetical protein
MDSICAVRVPVGGAHEEILEWSRAKVSGHIHEHITSMEQIKDEVKEVEEGQRMI